MFSDHVHFFAPNTKSGSKLSKDSPKVYKQFKTWKIDTSNKFNQRVSALDKIKFDENIQIRDEAFAIGTLANCSGCITPWRTILTCEENYDMFYGERNLHDDTIFIIHII